MPTTNRPVGGWGEILGDTTVAATMRDRFLHRSVAITLGGLSYRLRNHAAAAEERRRITTGTNTANLTRDPGIFDEHNRGKSVSTIRG